MRIISCDQSTSHCALTFWENKVPVEKKIIMTGATKSKAKKSDVKYFPIITQQIDYICEQVCIEIYRFKADKFVLEAPSMGSFGDAKATLLTLFRAIQETIQEHTNLTEGDVLSYAPTSVKSFARKYLPEEMQTVNGKKLKMEKKHMIMACENHAPEGWLDGLTLTAGKADYADSFWIGYKFLEENKDLWNN